MHRRRFSSLVALSLVVLACIWFRPHERAITVDLCERPVAFGNMRGGERGVVVCMGHETMDVRDLLLRFGHRGAGALEMPGRIHAGEGVWLLERGHVSRGPIPGDLRLTLGLKIDLNRASPEELEALPRIGPTLARRIVGSRRAEGRFSSALDLTRVRGIGPKTAKRLSPMVSCAAAKNGR